MKKLLGLSLVATLSLTAMASSSSAGTLTLFCKSPADVNCATRVVSALDKMGCVPQVNTLECQNFEGKVACEIDTLKCSEPRGDLVLTTKCFGGSKSSLKKQDRGLSLTWWMGIFGSYIRDICVE